MNTNPFAPDPDAQALAKTMLTFTTNKIRAAEIEHGVTWLGDNGPVYNVWDNNLARALYRDAAGRHYIDLALFRETLGGEPRKWAWMTDALLGDEDGDLWVEHGVATPQRGIFPCSCVDVDRVAELFHSQPESFPASLWARTWWSSPELTDAHELSLAEHAPFLMSRLPAELS